MAAKKKLKTKRPAPKKATKARAPKVKPFAPKIPVSLRALARRVGKALKSFSFTEQLQILYLIERMEAGKTTAAALKDLRTLADRQITDWESKMKANPYGAQVIKSLKRSQQIYAAVAKHAKPPASIVRA